MLLLRHPNKANVHYFDQKESLALYADFLATLPVADRDRLLKGDQKMKAKYRREFYMFLYMAVYVEGYLEDGDLVFLNPFGWFQIQDQMAVLLQGVMMLPSSKKNILHYEVPDLKSTFPKLRYVLPRNVEIASRTIYTPMGTLFRATIGGRAVYLRTAGKQHQVNLDQTVYYMGNYIGLPVFSF